jgi:Protein phosphatase 2C
MDWVYIVLILLVIACVGTSSWALSLRQRLDVAERQLRARPDVPRLPANAPKPPGPAPDLKPDPVPAPKPEPVPKPEPAEPPRSPEPEPLPDLAAPRALPNVVDSQPDSIVDGARLGRMTVRAAATRGELNRLDGLPRRQAVGVTVLSRFDPPALLSCVAAGLPSSEHSQLGAAQACRTLHGRLNERATSLALDAAWKDAGASASAAGNELRRLLGEAAAEVGKSLTLMAKSRNLEPESVSTSLTFLLSRLGDTPRRQHLVAGVGGGVLLRMSGNGKWSTDYEEAAQPLAGLPENAHLISCQPAETGPGDMLVLCSATTASFLQRDKISAGLIADWQAAPPDLVRFLWHLNQTDPAREDHAAVGIWELSPSAAG